MCLSPFLKDIERSLIRPALVCSLFVALGYIGQSVSLETISAGPAPPHPPSPPSTAHLCASARHPVALAPHGPDAEVPTRGSPAGKSGFICSLAVITCPVLEAVFDGRKVL